MIVHVGEVLAALAASFGLGSLIGWLIHRWIDRTDYAFDQRDLTDAIGRFFGIRSPALQGEAATPRAAHVPAEAAPTPVLSPTPIRATQLALPVPAPFMDEPLTADGASGARSEAAEDLRKRVQLSTRAAAWREARDERLRPGEAAAAAIAGGAAALAAEAAKAAAPAETARPARTAATATPPAKREAPKDDPWADSAKRAATAKEPTKASGGPAPPEHDEPWTKAPDIWPLDLAGRSADAGPTRHSTLPAVIRSDIVLRPLPAVAITVTHRPDDIWSDSDEQPAPPLSAPVADGADASPPRSDADRPKGFDVAPRDRDNLRRIKGIGQGFEKRLNELGIYRFAQVAAWTEREQAWISGELGFPGRVERDGWAAQAARLVKAGGRDSAASVPKA